MTRAQIAKAVTRAQLIALACKHGSSELSAGIFADKVLAGRAAAAKRKQGSK